MFKQNNDMLQRCVKKDLNRLIKLQKLTNKFKLNVTVLFNFGHLAQLNGIFVGYSLANCRVSQFHL